MGGNSGKKGNRKNDGPTAGKRSKISGSDVASSRKTSGKAMNMKELDRKKMRNVGYRKGDGDEVGGNSKVIGSRGETSLGMRVGASSKGSIQEKDKRKGSGTEEETTPYTRKKTRKRGKNASKKRKELQANKKWKT